MKELLRRCWHAIKRFVRSKDALVYLLFVLLATIMWITNAFSTRREISLIIPVRYTHVPDNYILTSAPSDHIRISMEDEGIDLYRNRHRNYELTFDLSGYITGEEGTFTLVMDEVRTAIVQQLTGDAGLVAFSPEILSGSYTRQHEKEVPIVYTGKIKPAAQHQLCGAPLLTPESAYVYGTEEALQALEYIETALTDFEGVQDTFTTRLPLLTPPNLRIHPDSVRIRVVAEQFTERAIQRPIATPDMAESGQLMHLFPSQATVTFRVGTAWFAKVSERDLEVYVEMPTDGTEHLPVRVKSRNPHITHIRVKPAEVEYLIESYERDSDGGSAASVSAD